MAYILGLRTVYFMCIPHFKFYCNFWVHNRSSVAELGCCFLFCLVLFCLGLGVLTKTFHRVAILPKLHVYVGRMYTLLSMKNISMAL